MLGFPLGILSAAGAAVGFESDYELISTTVLAGTAASVTFSSLGDYSSTYKHLQFRVAAQGTTNNANIGFSFNGDTGNNYAWHSLFGQGSSVSADSSINRANIIGSIPVVASSNTNQFTGSVIDILDAYNTSKFVTTRSLHGRASGGGNLIELDSGLWRDTASLTSVAFTITTGNINTGSRFSLYGIKG